MDALYAPWRQKYAGDVRKKNKKNTCVFCDIEQEKEDTKNFVIKRYKSCYVMLNTYPYNAGHVMIIPKKHCASLEDLSPKERTELMSVLSATVELVKKVLKPDGLNIGINLGKVAGAGLPDHLHVHVLPRWAGDTNFMPLLAHTKQVSFDLREIYKKLTFD